MPLPPQVTNRHSAKKHPQHTIDWDARFRNRDTPWEEAVVAPDVPHLFDTFARSGASVLDVGCGLGTNALWLAEQGFDVTGCDVSERAIETARKRAARRGLSVRFIVADLLDRRSDLPPFDVVLSRGVLHSFMTDAGRYAFAAAVSSVLVLNGLWFDISGSADTPGDPDRALAEGWPRLTLAQIAAAAETYFEVVEVRRTRYGTTASTGFNAFACVFVRRGDRHVEIAKGC